MQILLAVLLLSMLAALGGLVWYARKRAYHRWLKAYFHQIITRRPPEKSAPIHLILCFADHYEPRAGGATKERGMARVATWVERYPRQFAEFRDSDGQPPRYTFFFPAEEYEPEYLDGLANLCRQGFGEVEIHLHHNNDTAEGLRHSLLSFRQILVERHGLLARHAGTNEPVYGFIHGNWCLCNSRPDGQWCGVPNEIDILLETGCYADFTYPSAPHITQPPIINTIYYAKNIPGRNASHEVGVPITNQPMPSEYLLLIEGPLGLDWSRAKFGFLPGVENGCIQASQPPTIHRLENWLKAQVQVPNRPDWYFVKLHAHGAPEDAHDVLLGDPMVRFHRELAELARKNPNFHFHYVTAREMYNLAKAAEAGHQGSVQEARDFLLVSNLHQEAEVSR